MPDRGGVEFRARVTIEKVDVSGDEPVLVETVVMEDGKVISVERPAAPGAAGSTSAPVEGEA